ncbi:MAG: LamG domain-containing protein, partial [Bacteroidota bacterium]
MMKKYIVIILYFLAFSVATAQIMLPAYQGVFSTKTLSTVEASNGLNFDGVDDRVFSTNDVKFQISVGTIEGWIKTGNAGSSYRAAFGKHRAYCLYLYDNTLAIYDWGGAANRSTGITLNDNTWHHIAMTFKSGVTNGTLIYIDGVLKMTTTMTILNQVDPFIIGSTIDPYGQYYNGSIDDVRVWNVIRTQTEILDNMNTELLGSETGLVAYYPLNQGIAAGDNTAISTVTNKSANALNGTLTNFAKTSATSNFVIGKVPSSLIDDGLILSLDANNINSYSGTGSTWNDVSGNNRNGTLLAGVTYTNESEIKYFNFSSSYVAINLPKNPSMTY